jgi:hypothetical protein
MAGTSYSWFFSSASSRSSDAEPVVGRGGDDDDDDASSMFDLLQKLPELSVENELHDLSTSAGTASSAAAAVAEPLDAVGHEDDGSDDDDNCLLLDLIKRHPDLFEKEVLGRLGPAERAFLGQVNHGCRAAVLASDLPCAGTRVGMRQLNPADRARLARVVRAFNPYTVIHGIVSPQRDSSPFQSLEQVGYVESSNLPRAGEVVRLELAEFCTSPERLAWANDKGGRWDALTCALAARDGHLETLRWAR